MATKTATTKPIFKCEWRDVVALNFDVDPRLLQPLIPPGLRIDQFNDHTLITMMAKNVREFRPYGRSLTLFRSIDEIDLRTYVSWDVDGVTHRGHYKLKNLVSNKMASRVFKFLTGQEQMLVNKKRHTSGFEEARRDALPAADYSWSMEDSKSQFKVKARNAAKKGAENSKEQFVLSQRNRFVQTSKGTLCFPIRQAPWLVWTASSGSFDCDDELLLGKDFRRYFSRPKFALLSRGGEVTVSKGRKVTG